MYCEQFRIGVPGFFVKNPFGLYVARLHKVSFLLKNIFVCNFQKHIEF